MLPKIFEWEMAIFRPLLIIFLATAWISFTKQKFRRPFWGSEQVYILFGSKVMPQIQKTKNPKKVQKAWKILYYTNECFFTKSQKSRNRNICVLCHNFWANYNLDLLSTVNDRKSVFHFRPKPNIWPEKHLALGRIPKPKLNVLSN